MIFNNSDSGSGSGYYLDEILPYDEEEINLKRILQNDDNNIEANLNLGRHYLKKDILEKAERYFLKALVINSENTTALINLGSIYSRTERPSEAETFFLKALELKESVYGQIHIAATFVRV